MNLDFEKSDGLVTAVIQDHATGRVLMVGYMNEEAFRKTVETGFATFWSRSRRNCGSRAKAPATASSSRKSSPIATAIPCWSRWKP